MSEFKNIYIVGQGAIGRVLSGMLSDQGHKVTCIARQETTDKLRRLSSTHKGIKLSTPESSTLKPVKTHHLSYEELANSTKPDAADLVIYTVKSNYLADAVEKTVGLIDDKSAVVFTQGGLQWWFGHAAGTMALDQITDPDDAISQYIKAEQSFGGLISFGAGIEEEHPEIAILKNTKAPVICIPQNANPKHVNALKSLFADTPLDTPQYLDAQDNILKTAWEKAVGSFTMSAVALAKDMTLGEMAGDPDTMSMMVRIADELKTAGQKAGIQSDVDYRSYFNGIAQKLPNHIMSIVHDPSEIDKIIEQPYQIFQNAGLESEELARLVEQSREKAQKIIAQQAKKPQSP